MEKHEGKPDAIQTTAQADYADTEQLYTGKNKNTGSSQIKQSQSAVLREFLTLNPAALKDMITGEQYETISQSGNIMGEVWESSAPEPKPVRLYMKKVHSGDAMVHFLYYMIWTLSFSISCGFRQISCLRCAGSRSCASSSLQEVFASSPTF